MGEKLDSRSDPEIALVGIPEVSYKSELEILDRFQLFTAELLRIALLGIAVFGFLYEQIFADLTLNTPHLEFYCNPKIISVWSIVFFGLSTLCGLAHRYYSTDAGGFYIHAQRLKVRISNLLEQKNEAEINKIGELKDELKQWMEERDACLTKCSKAKLLSTLFLAVGASLMGYSLILILHR